MGTGRQKSNWGATPWHYKATLPSAIVLTVVLMGVFFLGLPRLQLLICPAGAFLSVPSDWGGFALILPMFFVAIALGFYFAAVGETLIRRTFGARPNHTFWTLPPGVPKRLGNMNLVPMMNKWLIIALPISLVGFFSNVCVSPAGVGYLQGFWTARQFYPWVDLREINVVCQHDYSYDLVMKDGSRFNLAAPYIFPPAYPQLSATLKGKDFTYSTKRNKDCVPWLGSIMDRRPGT